MTYSPRALRAHRLGAMIFAPTTGPCAPRPLGATLMAPGAPFRRRPSPCGGNDRYVLVHMPRWLGGGRATPHSPVRKAAQLTVTRVSVGYLVHIHYMYMYMYFMLQPDRK
jgi:hypothetical protein